MLRYGQLYAAAVLRPLAEQLVAAMRVSPGDTVCDVLCDGGELSRAFAMQMAGSGTVITADTDSDLAVAAARSIAVPGITATPVALSDTELPTDLQCASAGCLFTGGFAPLIAGRMRELVGSGGGAVIACWDPGEPPPHEALLAAALARAGVAAAYLDAVLRAPVDIGGAAVVHDVARFDGFSQYWAALVTERPLARELQPLPDRAVDEIQSACRRELHRYEAPDGTLRIPVTARVVEV